MVGLCHSFVYGETMTEAENVMRGAFGPDALNTITLSAFSASKESVKTLLPFWSNARPRGPTLTILSNGLGNLNIEGGYE